MSDQDEIFGPEPTGRLSEPRETPYQAVDRARRKRRLTMGAAVAVLLLGAVALAGWWLVGGDQDSSSTADELIPVFLCPDDPEPVALLANTDVVADAIDPTQEWVRLRTPAPGLDAAWARTADVDVEIVGLISAECTAAAPLEPTPTPPPAPTPTPTPAPTPTPTPRPLEEFRVLVANGSSIEGAAGQGTNVLSDAGFVTLGARNADPQDRTGVYYKPGFASEATAVARALGIDEGVVVPAPVELRDSGETEGADVVVIFGGESLTG